MSKMAPPAFRLSISVADFDGFQWSRFEGWLGSAEYFTGMELVSRSENWCPSVWRALCMDWKPRAGTFPEEDWHGCIVGGEWLPYTECDVLHHRVTTSLLPLSII
jgi:hypothetical protein